MVGVSGWATIGPDPVSDGVAAAMVGAYESSSGTRGVAPLGGDDGRGGVGIGYAGAVGVCSDGLVREIDPVDNGRGGVIISSVGADELYIVDIGRPARQRANASWNSTADWNRSSGVFASARVTTCSTHGGRSWRTRRRSASADR